MSKRTAENLRIGLMCGTFDPPHIGHLLLAEAALQQLNLEKILFLPVGVPPHKSDVTPAEQRAEMTRLAIEDNPLFELDTTDIDRAAPHYTATLLPILQEKHPTAQMWLIMGEDSLLDLLNWYRPDAILSQCRLAVLNRPHVHALNGATSVDELRQQLPNINSKVDYLSGMQIDISSTYIRQALRKQQTLRYILSAKLLAYIKHAGLFAAAKI